MINMCRCSNGNKNCSKPPTSDYITDLAESIIIQEWISGSENYIAHRFGRYRWLVIYKGTNGEKMVDPRRWKSLLETKNSDVLADRNDNSTPANYMKDFGVISRFKRAYEITYDKETSCLE